MCVSVCTTLFLYLRSESAGWSVYFVYIVCDFLSNQQACRAEFPCYFSPVSVCFWLSRRTLECLQQRRPSSSGEVESSAAVESRSEAYQDIFKPKWS